jgi:hypothetical protein
MCSETPLGLIELLSVLDTCLTMLYRKIDVADSMSGDMFRNFRVDHSQP